VPSGLSAGGRSFKGMNEHGHGAMDPFYFDPAAITGATGPAGGTAGAWTTTVGAQHSSGLNDGYHSDAPLYAWTTIGSPARIFPVDSNPLPTALEIVLFVFAVSVLVACGRVALRAVASFVITLRLPSAPWTL
jgi:hypothetical protein